MNKFFYSTAARVTGKEPVETSDIYRAITLLPENNTTEQFELQKTNSNEVLKTIKSLCNDCSTWYDNIPIFLIKPVAEYVSCPPAFIINNQILTRTFSKKWKISPICPFLTVNKSETPVDYRPMSLLPILSKFYEKIILQQMTLYIEKVIIYHHYQSGYRKNHSTLTILIKLWDNIKRATNSGEVTLAVFVDFSKVFDTIDFNILILKLYSLHFSKNFLYLILNYLPNRSHFVQINSRCSNFLYSEFGVPQVSILGLVLFTLCVSDTKNCVPRCTCLQYADDSTTYRHCKAKDIKKSCENILTSELSNMLTWSSSNNLMQPERKQCYLPLAK